MKKVSVLMIIALLLSLCSCMTTYSVFSDDLATLDYDDGVTEIHVTLTQEETAFLRSVIDDADFGLGGASCGFSEEISFTVDGTTYQVAQDTCPIIRKGFLDATVSERDIDEIHSLFEDYGGYLPCI